MCSMGAADSCGQHSDSPGFPRPPYDRALCALRTRLDSWPGIGHVAVAMHRQGYDLQLTQYDDRGWRATFYTTGMEHSPTSATGTAWERTPWHATQRAAWEALTKASLDGYPALLPIVNGYAFIRVCLTARFFG
jgi:hypothetical protein